MQKTAEQQAYQNGFLDGLKCASEVARMCMRRFHYKKRKARDPLAKQEMWHNAKAALIVAQALEEIVKDKGGSDVGA